MPYFFSFLWLVWFGTTHEVYYLPNCIGYLSSDSFLSCLIRALVPYYYYYYYYYHYYYYYYYYYNSYMAESHISLVKNMAWNNIVKHNSFVVFCDFENGKVNSVFNYRKSCRDVQSKSTIHRDRINMRHLSKHVKLCALDNSILYFC